MRWRARPSRGAGCGHRAASSLSGGDSGRRRANTAPRATQDQACLRRGVEERPPCSRPRRAAPCQAGDPLRRSACPLHRRDLPHRLARFCAHGGGADAFAEYYSLQLSVNIRRGQRYNAERALSNGHKIFGFAVDQCKRYIPDPETAPIVTQIFHDYASGVSMQKTHRLEVSGWV